MDDPPADNRTNKTPEQEKSNTKRHQNNNNNKDKKYFCMLHRHNPTHITKQRRTLKKEAENDKKGRENDNLENIKRRYNPSKEEIHLLTAFSKK